MRCNAPVSLAIWRARRSAKSKGASLVEVRPKVQRNQGRVARGKRASAQHAREVCCWQQGSPVGLVLALRETTLKRGFTKAKKKGGTRKHHPIPKQDKTHPRNRAGAAAFAFAAASGAGASAPPVSAETPHDCSSTRRGRVSATMIAPRQPLKRKRHKEVEKKK